MAKNGVKQNQEEEFSVMNAVYKMLTEVEMQGTFYWKEQNFDLMIYLILNFLKFEWNFLGDSGISLILFSVLIPFTYLNEFLIALAERIWS